MHHPILRAGAPALSQPAERVNEITPEISALIDDMIDTMHAAPGVGLAAPQVGIPLRIFVIDLSVGRNPDEVIVLVNPEVMSREGLQRQREGCLSLPGFEAAVPRPRRVVVRGLNRAGQPCTVEGTNLLARALQHELDHLDGRLFVDRLRPLRRLAINWRVRRLQRKGRW
jgi:peptide deformylase